MNHQATPPRWNKAPRWTAREDAILAEVVGTEPLTLQKVAEAMKRLPGRSADGIEVRVRKWRRENPHLKPSVQYRPHGWTEAEEQILLDHFGQHRFSHKVGEKLLPKLPGRTLSAIENRLHKLRKHDPRFQALAVKWTKAEDDLIVQYGKMFRWKTMTVEAEIRARKLLPNRTKAAILSRITDLKKEHGVITEFRRSLPKWDFAEDEGLYKVLETEKPSLKLAQSLAEKLGRWSPYQILARLRHLNQVLTDEPEKETPAPKFEAFAAKLPTRLLLGQRNQALSIARYDLAAAKRYVKFCLETRKVNPETELIAS